MTSKPIWTALKTIYKVSKQIQDHLHLICLEIEIILNELRLQGPTQLFSALIEYTFPLMSEILI